jgi:hypothetical protein
VLTSWSPELRFAMDWVDQVKHALREYFDGQLCVRCVHQLAPALTLRDVDRVLRSLEGSPHYVSRYEAACSRCGEIREVFALV